MAAASDLKPGRIYLRDAEETGQCPTGCWKFAKQAGLDFHKFYHEGLTFEEVAHIPDARLRATVEHARAKRGVAE